MGWRPRRTRPACLPKSKAGTPPSALEGLEPRGRTGAQEAEIAADREVAGAALGERNRPFGGVAIGAEDLAGLARRLRDPLELAIDVGRRGIGRRALK